MATFDPVQHLCECDMQDSVNISLSNILLDFEEDFKETKHKEHALGNTRH